MIEETDRVHPAPRLSVLLATDAPVGVIFRRGPSKLVRLVMWDRQRDKFKPGSWFRGRIFAHRSDISPDGRHLIYFAMGGVAWAIPATGGTWTAISELPSLKAKALWGQGDTWSGGGVFLSNNTFWLNADDCTFLIRDNSGLRRETSDPYRGYEWCLNQRGWTWKNPGEGTAICEKVVREGWILRMIGWGIRYELELPGECKLEFPQWEWADWDRGRLAWAEGGCLRAARLGTHKLGTVHTLYDFNTMVPPHRTSTSDQQEE